MHYTYKCTWSHIHAYLSPVISSPRVLSLLNGTVGDGGGGNNDNGDDDDKSNVTKHNGVK